MNVWMCDSGTMRGKGAGPVMHPMRCAPYKGKGTGTFGAWMKAWTKQALKMSTACIFYGLVLNKKRRQVNISPSHFHLRTLISSH